VQIRKGSVFSYLDFSPDCGIAVFKGYFKLVDVAHDSIQKDETLLCGEDTWIHRKGACQIIPDKPVVIAGSYNMNSFLGIGLKANENHKKYLNSYDHGSSYITEYYQEQNKLESSEGYTRRYFLNNDLVSEVKHVKPTPVEYITNSLIEKGLIKPVAWLKPIANYKVK